MGRPTPPQRSQTRRSAERGATDETRRVAQHGRRSRVDCAPESLLASVTRAEHGSTPNPIRSATKEPGNNESAIGAPGGNLWGAYQTVLCHDLFDQLLASSLGRFISESPAEPSISSGDGMTANIRRAAAVDRERRLSFQ